MNDPNLDSIMTKERKLIMMRQLIREQKNQTIKTIDGKTILIPSLPPKPIEVGISPRNGIPVKPKIDFEVRKHAKKRV